MEFLLDNKEYELIRLSFKSNEQLLKERNYQNLKEYEKFLGLLDNNLHANAKYDPCEINAYMDKFTNFVNKILEENAKLEEMEAKRREKEQKNRPRLFTLVYRQYLKYCLSYNFSLREKVGDIMKKKSFLH